MPIVQAQNDSRVFLDEEFSEKNVSEDFVGRKGLSLFHLRKMDVPVPPFLVLSGTIFTEYIKECLGSDIDSKTSDADIREKILKGAFTQETKEHVIEAYSRLSGFTDSWVSVRSSIILPPTRRDISFAGMLDTVLNVKGVDDVFLSIRKVYASAFTSQVAMYLSQVGLSIADIKVATVVQKMVQAEASGVVFTTDPITMDNSYLTIEAVFGLGDVIADGLITPDQYVIEKDTLEFKEKRIVPQDWMMVRKITNKDNAGGDQKVQISKSWQSQQKLENRYVNELAKIALIVEKAEKEPLDLEWVFEGGRIWLLQASTAQPVTIPQRDDIILTMEPSIVTAAQEIAEKESTRQAIKDVLAHRSRPKEDPVPLTEETKQEISQTEPESEVFAAKPLTRQVIHGHDTSKQSSTPQTPIAQFSPLPGEKLLITGIGASPSNFRGSAVIISSESDISDKKGSLTKDAVAVLSEPFNSFQEFSSAVGAVVMDTAGMTSDIATRCRENAIPCVAGTHIASRMLKERENILVDGTIGAVYGKRDLVEPPPPPPKLEQKPMSVIEKIRSKPEPQTPHEVPEPAAETARITPTETLPAKTSTPPRVRTATKVLVHLSGAFSKNDSWKKYIPEADGVSGVQIEDIYEKNKRHPEAYIAEGKKQELVTHIAEEISAICEISEGNPVIVSIGSASVSSYRKLTKGNIYETLENKEIKDQTRGLSRLLLHPKELSAIFATIRRTRNVHGWRNACIAVSYPGSPKALAEFKKLMTAGGLRRSSTLKLYLTIDTPSEAMIIEDFIKAGVDGVIIDISCLAKHMMAQSEDDESVLKLIGSITSTCKNTTVILTLPNNNILKKSVALGVWGVTCAPSDLTATRKSLSQLEQEAVFKR